MTRSDDGFASVEWALALVVVLLPAFLAAVSVSGWAERGMTARSMAAEAARAAVLADVPSEIDTAARRVAKSIAVSRGVELAPDCGVASDRCATLSIEGSLQRGDEITVDVVVPVRMLVLPGIGEFGAFAWTARVAERVDDYRSFDVP